MRYKGKGSRPVNEYGVHRLLRLTPLDLHYLSDYMLPPGAFPSIACFHMKAATGVWALSLLGLVIAHR
jgi:hypothetical protein